MENINKSTQTTEKVLSSSHTHYSGLLILFGSAALYGLGLFTGFLIWEMKTDTTEIATKQKTEVSPHVIKEISTTITKPPSTIDTSNWKTYTTSSVFGLSDAMLQEYPTLAKRNVKFTFPDDWILSTTKPAFSNGKKYGILLGANLSKHDPKYPQGGEGPSDKSAYIQLRIKETTSSVDELITRYIEEFGEGSAQDKPLTKQIFNGYKAAKIMREQPIPHVILFSVSPTTVMNITVDFYDNGNDKVYSEKTIQEISAILNSVKIIN